MSAHWPRVDPHDPGIPPEDQDRSVHPIPPLVLIAEIFDDLTSERDRVYNH